MRFIFLLTPVIFAFISNAFAALPINGSLVPKLTDCDTQLMRPGETTTLDEGMTISRGLSEYERNLPPLTAIGFSGIQEFLNSLKASDTIIDAGAGEANAWIEYLSRESRANTPRIVAINNTVPRIGHEKINQTSQQYPQLLYIYNLPIERITTEQRDVYKLMPTSLRPTV